MPIRIEPDGELTPEEAAAVHAAIERYAATSAGKAPVADGPDPWAEAARTRAMRGERPVRTGGRDEWQAARDHRRRSREATT
jgi:hypothetical protein